MIKIKALLCCVFISIHVWAGSDPCEDEMVKRARALLKNVKDGHLPEAKILGSTLYLNGIIDGNMQGEFQALFNNREDPQGSKERSDKVTKVVLNSPGGSVRYSDEILKWMKSKGPSLEVIVPGGGICASACAELFRCAGNAHRFADESAYILYHPSDTETLGGAKPGKEKLRAYRKAVATDFAVEKSDCAQEAYKTKGGRAITEGIMSKKTLCYKAHDLAGDMGFLQIRNFTMPASFKSGEDATANAAK